MFVRLPAADPSAGFTVLLGSVAPATDSVLFEFPLNFPPRFFGALGIFRAALLFICQGSVSAPY